jgi:GNAT superfamily N-acetyltransferase
VRPGSGARGAPPRAAGGGSPRPSEAALGRCEGQREPAADVPGALERTEVSAAAPGESAGPRSPPASAPGEGRATLRRAGARDLAALAALFEELLVHHAALDRAFAVRPEGIERLPALLARQLRDADAATFVFDREGELSGFCTVRVERAPSLLFEAARAEITDLGVRPGRRRQGIGRALAEAARAWAAERGAARLEVRVAAANPEGQAFWRALGYQRFVDVLQQRL